MDTTITAISKFAPADISMDYERLRTEGILHLEDLATYIWTDFNAHDPGITMLEVLCYAITDLGYRANLPIEDILATNGGSTAASFFSATEVLPICPITRNDYRKILIDFPGIRNAWIEKVYPEDVPLYLKKNKIEKNQNAVVTNLLKKLKVFDSDVEEKIKKLLQNENGISVGVKKIMSSLEEILKRVDSTLQEGKANIIKKFVDFLLTISSFYEFYYDRNFKENAEAAQTDFIDKWNITDETKSLLKEKGLMDIAVYYNFFVEIEAEEDIPKVIDLLNEWLCKYSYFEVSKTQETDFKRICLNGLYRICLDTHQSIDPESKAARKLIEKIKKGYTENSTKKRYKGLYEYRNLGEDFYDVQIVPAQKINLCLDINVDEEADEHEVMAAVIFRLQEFLTPAVPFHTLQQLFEQGRTCDEIFNGPLLSNGFIDDEELEKAVIPEHLRLSDLYKIILDTTNVLSINSLKTRHHAEGEDQEDFVAEWCFEYDKEDTNCPTKPIIELSNSTLYAQINGISHLVQEKDISDQIALLRLASRNLMANTNNEPLLPHGTFRADLDDYVSVQYEFPHNYTIGDHGLPDDALPLRKAQAKQLQAYLLFFDRLLADYLKQLSEVRNLLSINQDATTATFFYQTLYEVPGIQELIRDEALEEVENESDWQAYQADEENKYVEKLQGIVETKDGKFNRKHRILNHLLARFGEQFTTYAAHIFKTRQQHLEAKTDFLKALPVLGLEKAKAYHYKARKDNGSPNVWARDTNDTVNLPNVSGLKKRIYKLLGWGDATTESVFHNPVYRIDEEEDVSRDLPFRFFSLYSLNEEGEREEPLLKSEKSYSPRKIKSIKPKLYVQIDNEENYEIAQEAVDSDEFRGKFTATAIDGDDDVILQSQIMSEAEAELRMRKIKTLINAELKNGFHLLEHILLRPNDPEDALLQMGYTCDLQFTPIDPYSFWVSIIVPAWMGQFQEEEYRNYFMQLVRREMPAHIALCFRWVEEEDDMQNLENALEQWREAFAECTPDECEVTEKAEKLIELLNGLPCDCYCFSEGSFSSNC